MNPWVGSALLATFGLIGIIGLAQLAFAQVIPAQNQVTQSPFGGLVYSTSTSGTAKLGQLKGIAFGQLALWDGTKWIAAATSTLGISATPAAPFTSVQFNDSGSFGGDANFTWTKTATNEHLTLHETDGNTTLKIQGTTLSGKDATSGNNAGDSIQINGGSGFGNGAGGDFSLFGGLGSGSESGGDFTITSGNGGDTGNGGNQTFNAGLGGGTSGSGGSFYFTAGNAQGGNSNGGTIVFTSGTSTGSGTNGQFLFSEAVNASTGRLNFGNLTSSRVFTFPDASGTFCLIGLTCDNTGTSTNPLMATYFVATSTTVASRFPYASTTALSWTATSTGSNGVALSGGCFQMPNGACLVTSSGGTVTSITAGLGLNGGTITTSGTVSMKSYLATSSAETAGQIAYWTSSAGTPATLGSVATGTVSAGSSAITVTANRFVIGGALSIDCATASGSQTGCLSSTDWSIFNSKISSTSLSASFPLTYNSSTGVFAFIGLATTSPWTQGELAFVSGANQNRIASVATSSLGVTSPITFSGTLGAQVGGTGGSFACATCLTTSFWPWTIATTYGTTTNSTTTPLWLKTALYASSSPNFPSIIDNLLTTNSLTANGFTGSTPAATVNFNTTKQNALRVNVNPEGIGLSLPGNSDFGAISLVADAGASITKYGVYSFVRGGTGNRYSFFADGDDVAGSSFSLYSPNPNTVLYNNGSVGIGTTTPGTILSVQGVANFHTATSTFQSTGGINLTAGCFAIGGTCLSSGGSGTVGSGTTGQMPYYAANGTTLTATSTVFLSTGSNVGIAQTSPAARLDVSGTIIQTGAASFSTGYLRTNSGNSASQTAINPGIAVYGADGAQDGYGMDLGYNATSSRYRTRIFNGNAVTDIALGAMLTGVPTLQSQYNEFLTVRGDSGNVGISTTTPWNKLVVRGTGIGSVAMGGLAENTAYGAIYLNGLQTSGNYNLTSGPNDQSLYINRPNGNSIKFVEQNGTPQMVIIPGGNVGVGSSSPGQKFDVGGVINTSNGYYVNSRTFLDWTSTYNRIQDASGGNAIQMGGAGDQSNIYQNTTHKFQSLGGGTDYMRITSTGNVGIGTIGPSSKLTTVGASTYNETFLTGNLLVVDSANTARAVDIGYDPNLESGFIQAGKNGVSYEPLLLNPNAGNVAIGTTTSSKTLGIKGGGNGSILLGDPACGGDYSAINLYGALTGCSDFNFTSSPADRTLYINRPSGAAIRFREGNTGTDSMYLASGGKVGIGNTSPAQPLDVTGTIRQSGCTTIGTLSANASGDIVCTVSSEKFKDNIKSIPSHAEEPIDINANLLALRPVSFTLKPSLDMGTSTHEGFISEEAAVVNPTFATYDKEGKPYGIDPVAILSEVVKGIQNILARLDGNDAKIKELEARVTALEKK